ncbi:MAG: bifunctional [glutamine synthetase] adenylyltransferase/[glutamine synthetase]-adenylyl-L-tyrosine phosphorylase, partial [Geodermatophilaceae bacterium]|nr:bifunctional [glutamine synthetase] adenylyltransferase/[glutamine synthetase]-adenylyl-L-tyrosine phosphorylase [Geodermatophilaceae bacterium]
MAVRDSSQRRAARLSRLGFAEGSRAADLIVEPSLGLWDADTDTPAADGAAEVLAALTRSGDPDLALASLHRLALAGDQPEELQRALATDPALRRRLCAVLGASSALGDHLVAHPGDWRLLTQEGLCTEPRSAADLTAHLLDVVGADPETPPTGTRGSAATTDRREGVAALRLAYRRELLVLATRDLAESADLEQVTGELSDLAAATLSAALALAAGSVPDDAPVVRLAIIAMGKCGGRELNYVSDVDVIFVGEPADRTATRLAADVMAICDQVAWPVDAALRPEGKTGPLVRTLDSHVTYYQKWARTWEFQALLKMRPVAGDPELGAAYVEQLRPMVWAAAEREHFVEDVQKMRRRVEANIPTQLADRELKLGPGGLRDVEFSVQLLQLVHGRVDEKLRLGGTLPALTELTAGGYIGREDGEILAVSYRLLRTVEHRLQLMRLRRTHLLPDDRGQLRWLARSLGYRPDHRGEPADVLAAELSLHTRHVRRLHEKLFYRPLLNAVSRVPGDQLRLAPEAARGWLAALGFSAPEAALAHLGALTSGVSRTAAMQRLLLPVVLQSFTNSADPDAGLLAYRSVSEQLGRTPWYLRLLRDEVKVLERLGQLLGTSMFIADLLGGAPEALKLLGDDAQLRPVELTDLAVAWTAVVARSPDPVEAVTAVRALRRHELLRLAMGDLLGLVPHRQTLAGLSDAATATIRAALRAAIREVVGSEADLPTRFVVIGMGRLGGRELGYGSDADVLFVHDPKDGADEQVCARAAADVAERLRTLLAAPASDPPLSIDTGLRPEGRNGPVVRSLASYRAYYQRWAQVWERQALLRAVPVAGDAELGAEFVSLVEPLRYPSGGLPKSDVVEIRRIKARVDSERLPRGADPATHTKLGRGGLADVEWTTQLLQLRHAGEHESLRSTGTLEALRAMVGLGLLGEEDALALEAGWMMASRSRNAIMLVRGRAGDQLPRPGKELLGVTRAMGY